MNVKILGIGCANCQTLEKRTREALDQLGVEAVVEEVTDMKDIASFGVIGLPGLVVDDKVIVSGRVPQTEELTTLLAGAAIAG